MRIAKISRVGEAIFTIALFSFLINPMAQAQEKPEDFEQADSYLRYMPSRGIEDSSGKIGITESGAEYNYGFQLFNKLPMKFSLDTQNIDIKDSQDNIELPAHLTGVSIGIEATSPFFNLRETYQRFGITPSFYEDGYEFEGSSFRIPMYYFLIRRPNEKWTFLAGFAYYPDFENEFFPIFGCIYKPNERLTFNLVPKRPGVYYLLNQKMTLFAEGGVTLNREYEVDRENLKNVVLGYKEMRLGGGIKFKINQAIEASVSAGGMFSRSFEYKDDQGKVDLKDGSYVELRFEIKP